MEPLEFVRRQVAERAVEARGVVPVHVAEDSEFETFERRPERVTVDELRLEDAVDAFGKRVVVAASDRADGCLEACLCEAFGVPDGEILGAAVAVMNQRTVDPSPVQGLLQGIEREVRPKRFRYPPTHDGPAEHIGDESDVGKPCTGGDVRDVGNPELVRLVCDEPAANEILGTVRSLGGECWGVSRDRTLELG